jgi:fructuronate reductase
VPREITCLSDVGYAGEDRRPILAAMAAPDVGLVSLTITEKGYCHKNGQLDVSHPDIQHDIENPETPVSAPGFIVAALARRRAAGTPSFTCLSCDNLADNGRLLARVVTDLAALVDPALGRWIEAETRFPVSMVDRIVPATTKDDRDDVLRLVGRKDQAPVIHEPFWQWVIEDDFGPMGRPDLASVGVQLVADVTPHEMMKLRCLNGSHTALALLGQLHGKQTVSAAITDPLLAGFIDSLWSQEIIPSVTVPQGQDITAYCKALGARFSNPRIIHQTAQIAMDTSQKLPPRILAPLEENLAAGRPIAGLCLVIAGWMAFVRQLHDMEQPLHDPLADRINGIISTTPDGDGYVEAMLGLEGVFSAAIVSHDMVIDTVSQWYRRIGADGIAACLEDAAALNWDSSNRSAQE